MTYYQRDDEAFSLHKNYLSDSADETSPKPNFLSKWIVRMLLVAVLISSIFMVTYKSKDKALVTNLSSETLSETPRQYFSVLRDSEVLDLWSDFKLKYDKKYKEVDEESKRFENFKAFLRVCDDRNEAEEEEGGTAVHGVTQFADLSTREFEEGYLGGGGAGFFLSEGDLLLAGRNSSDVHSKHVENFHPNKSNETFHHHYGALIPTWWHHNSTANKTYNHTYVNWARELTTTVNNQGYCGACWAFSAVQQVESDAIRAGLLRPDEKLSYEQVVSCEQTNPRCGVGETGKVYEYIHHNGGIVSYEDYPYDSRGGEPHQCDHRETAKKKSVQVNGYYRVYEEGDMIDFVLSTGPLSVCLNGDTLASYTGGVITNCGTTINHCVQIVGVNVAEGYWIVRNSWGQVWGKHGYYYIALNQSLCNIDYMPTFTNVSLATT